MMNARQWREAGYFVMFRNGNVILIQKDTLVARTMSVRGGVWMAFEWEHFVPVALNSDTIEAMRACYCASLSNGSCDFCTGCRKVPVHGGAR